jgi:hypothetical protein
MLRPSQRWFRWLIVAEAAAFALSMAVIWLDEWLDMPHLLLGDPVSPARFHEAAVESACIGVSGIVAVGASLALMRRLRQSENYVAMCAWCRKVRVDDRWMPFEDFLLHQNDLRTSHSICEQCAADVKKPQASR